MILIPKINCYNSDKFGGCSKKPRSFFGLFKASCCEASIDGGTKCDVADRRPRPTTPPPPMKKRRIPLYTDENGKDQYEI
jgi:hypothetical protein